MMPCSVEVLRKLYRFINRLQQAECSITSFSWAFRSGRRFTKHCYIQQWKHSFVIRIPEIWSVISFCKRKHWFVQVSSNNVGQKTPNNSYLAPRLSFSAKTRLRAYVNLSCWWQCILPRVLSPLSCSAIVNMCETRAIHKEVSWKISIQQNITFWANIQ